MKVCNYCKTENLADQSSCTFCAADLLATRYKRKNFIDMSDVIKPLNQKAKYHTYDLILMLKIVRAELNDNFKLNRTVKRALHSNIDVSGEMQADAQLNVDNAYKYRYQLEELLIDRLGYYPKQITDNLLQNYEKKLR